MRLGACDLTRAHPIEGRRILFWVASFGGGYSQTTAPRVVLPSISIVTSRAETKFLITISKTTQQTSFASK